MKKIVFTFGRYNPPTTGHAELITHAVKLAQRSGADHRIYTSNSHDPSKNPLSPAQKIGFLRQIFPGVNFIADQKMRTVFDICKKLTEEGYEDVTFVVGDDRVSEFRTQLGKYVKPKTAKDFNPKINYPFKKFQVVSSGARKKGISGTDLRAAVRKGDFKTFAAASAARDKTLAKKIFDATRPQLKEQYLAEEGVKRTEFHDKLLSFVDYTCKQLGISEPPKLLYKDDKGEGQPSFGGYAPAEKKLYVYTKNRHPMDIFRTVAHELVHHKQNLDGRLGKDITKEGSTGSDIENEANSEAGKIMRYFGRDNPFYFDMGYVTESKAIILVGTPGSGKDKILKEAILPFGFRELNPDEFRKYKLSENVVINGASDYFQVQTIKEALEIRGYKTMMVFVNTSDEVSKQRNESRALKGGRVITETIRFEKWKGAQDNLDKFQELFEKLIVVNNDLDLNQSHDVIQKTHNKLMEAVSKDIKEFMANQIDVNFENMLRENYSDFSPTTRQNPVGGAGNFGTQKLTDRYKADTPGQEPGQFAKMKVVKLKKDNVRVFGKLPGFGDRLGGTYTSAKNPSFVGDLTSDNTFSQGNPYLPPEPIARWMVKEETKRRFKEKYGKLAEQKIRETAARLSRESLEDPFSGGMSDVSVTGGPGESNRPDNLDRNGKIGKLPVGKRNRRITK